LVKKRAMAIVDAPEISLEEDDLAGDVLIKFYKALGWDGQQLLEPCKVQTTKDVYLKLYDIMSELCPDRITVGMAMVNKAPSVRNDVPEGKVFLLEGWLIPDSSGGE